MRFCEKQNLRREMYKGPLIIKFERFILTYEATIAKKGLLPTLSCKVSQSDPIAMKLHKLHETHVVPPTECINQISNSYLKACWKQVRKTRTDGYCHGIMQQFFTGGYRKILLKYFQLDRIEIDDLLSFYNGVYVKCQPYKGTKMEPDM